MELANLSPSGMIRLWDMRSFASFYSSSPPVHYLAIRINIFAGCRRRRRQRRIALCKDATGTRPKLLHSLTRRCPRAIEIGFVDWSLRTSRQTDIQVSVLHIFRSRRRRASSVVSFIRLPFLPPVHPLWMHFILSRVVVIVVVAGPHCHYQQICRFLFGSVGSVFGHVIQRQSGRIVSPFFRNTSDWLPAFEWGPQNCTMSRTFMNDDDGGEGRGARRTKR